MTGFIVRRVLTSIVVVILTSIFVFVLFFKGLGDSPARNYCEIQMFLKVGIPRVLSSKSPWIFDPWAWAMPP